MNVYFNGLILLSPLVILKTLNGHQRIWALSIVYSLLFGLMQFPNELVLQSEVYTNYIFWIERLAIPSINPPYNSSPLYYVLALFIKVIFGVNDTAIVYISRLILFSFNLYAFIYLARSLKILKNQELFLLFSFFFFLFDWNFNYLLTGDQLRNSLGAGCFMIAMGALKEQKYKLMIFYSITAFLSHKMFLIILPFFVINYYIFSKTEVFQSKRMVFCLIPILSISSIFLIKYILINFNFFGFLDKVNHPMLLGVWDSFLSRPGVLLATIIHLTILGLSWWYFHDLKKNIFLLTFVCQILFYITISRAGILNVNFVEPNRIYIIFSPMAAILLGYFSMKVEKIYRWSLFIAFFLINFLFKNFSKESSLVFKNILNFSWVELFQLIYQVEIFTEKTFISLLLILFIMLLVVNYSAKKTIFVSSILLLAALTNSTDLFYQILFFTIMLTGLHTEKYKMKMVLNNFLAIGLLGVAIFYFCKNQFLGIELIYGGNNQLLADLGIVLDSKRIIPTIDTLKSIIKFNWHVLIHLFKLTIVIYSISKLLYWAIQYLSTVEFLTKKNYWRNRYDRLGILRFLIPVLKNHKRPN